jgi:hypothetical protein
MIAELQLEIDALLAEPASHSTLYEDARPAQEQENASKCEREVERHD